MTVTQRDDVLSALQIFTGFQTDTAAAEAFMVVVDAYAAGMASALPGAPQALLDAYASTLASLVNLLADAAAPAAPPALLHQVIHGTGKQRECRTCHKEKDLERDFYADKKGPDGRKTQCKDCEREHKQASKNAA